MLDSDKIGSFLQTLAMYSKENDEKMSRPNLLRVIEKAEDVLIRYREMEVR